MSEKKYPIWFDERPLAKILWNPSLKARLDEWKKDPNSHELQEKMEKVLSYINSKKFPLTIKVKSDALKNQDQLDIGRIEGDFWICDTSLHNLVMHASNGTNRPAILLVGRLHSMDIFFPEEIESITITE